MNKANSAKKKASKRGSRKKTLKRRRTKKFMGSGPVRFGRAFKTQRLNRSVAWKRERILSLAGDHRLRMWCSRRHPLKSVDAASHVEFLSYQRHEYNKVRSSGWTKRETDLLLDVCRQYNLRWSVIHERYNRQRSRNQRDRSVTDLKARFFWIQNTLHVDHGGSIISDRKRKKEDVEDTGAILFKSLNREKEVNRRKKTDEFQRRTQQQIEDVEEKLEKEKREQNEVNKEIRDHEKRETELTEKHRLITLKADKITKNDTVLTTGGIYGFNAGYGVIVRDEWKRPPDPLGGPLHDVPEQIRPIAKPLKRKYLTTTDATAIEPRMYRLDIGFRRPRVISVQFPHNERKNGVVVDTSTNTVVESVELSEPPSKRRRLDTSSTSSPSVALVNGHGGAPQTREQKKAERKAESKKIGEQLAEETEFYLRDNWVLDEHYNLPFVSSTVLSMYEKLREDTLTMFALKKLNERLPKLSQTQSQTSTPIQSPTQAPAPRPSPPQQPSQPVTVAKHPQPNPQPAMRLRPRPYPRPRPTPRPQPRSAVK